MCHLRHWGLKSLFMGRMRAFGVAQLESAMVSYSVICGVSHVQPSSSSACDPILYSLRGCLGFAEASLLGMAQETEKPCLKPSLTVLHMLVPMLCVGTHTRNALRSKTAKFGRRAPWRAFPRRTVGTRKQKPKQPLSIPSSSSTRYIKTQSGSNCLPHASSSACSGSIYRSSCLIISAKVRARDTPRSLSTSSSALRVSPLRL